MSVIRDRVRIEDLFSTPIISFAPGSDAARILENCPGAYLMPYEWSDEDEKRFRESNPRDYSVANT